MKIEELINNNEILIWSRDIWNNWNQHDNIYTFLLDLETLQSIPTYSLFITRTENSDSRKNIHRKTFICLSDLKKFMAESHSVMKIVHIIHDYEDSFIRIITVTYYAYGHNTDSFIELDEIKQVYS